MDPDEIFKRFFGVSLPEIGNRPFRPMNDRDGDNPCGECHPRTDGTDVFGDLHVRMHQQMEEMDKMMEDAFQLFGFHSHIPAGVPTLPEGSEENKPFSGYSARDQMLKEGGTTPSPHSPEQPSSRAFSGGFFSPWMESFIGTPRLDTISPKERKDADIDGESPNKENIVDLYERSRSRDPFVHFFGGGQSVNIQTVVGGDGVVEERRTIKDSSGREETTITRRIGDKSHTVTTITDENGLEEKRETFQNINKDKMSEFDKHWQGKGHNAGPVTDSSAAVLKPGGALSDNRSFFRKFFGF